jgi:hypothetical protein
MIDTRPISQQTWIILTYIYIIDYYMKFVHTLVSCLNSYEASDLLGMERDVSNLEGIAVRIKVMSENISIID